MWRSSTPLRPPERDERARDEGGRTAALRDCGRWYIALGSHVVRAHDMTVREYQIEHDLPVSRGLASEDFLAARSESMRALVAERPELAENISGRAAAAAAARDPEMLRRAPTLRAPDVPARIAETLRERVPPVVCAVCATSFRPRDRRTKTCGPSCHDVLRARDRARGVRTAERDAQIRAAREAGETLEAIGQRHGMTKQGVRYILQRDTQP